MLIEDGTGPAGVGAIKDTNIDDATKAVDGLIDFAKIWNSTSLTKPFESIKVVLQGIGGQLGPSGIFEAIQNLDQEATKLVKTLGVSKERASELTQTVADAIPMFVALGAEVGDVSVVFKDISESFGSNVSLNAESLKDLKATSIVTGVEVKTLASSFKNVGVSINDVGDRMLEVTKIARQSGALVSAVSAGVVANLGKMNLYNFEGGTKGLAKMAAQASKLGIDMVNIFNVVDKVFNPEGAIELSASLQRLGVTSSQLLDPLRMMDLSQNDPAELQNQIVQMTKEFTYFNKQNNSIEILPGSKRRLEEIGKAMGFQNHELQSMAINAGNLEYKMKQIKFSPDIKDEDRELVATMSQIGKEGTAFAGKAVVKVETGENTGVFEDKLVSALEAKDVENLAKQQLDNSKSMEEIAIDQLMELRKLTTNINSVVGAIKYGTASSPTVQKGYKGSIKALEGTVNEYIPMGEDAKKSDTYRKGIETGIDAISSTVTSIISGDFQSIIDKVGEYATSAFKEIKEVFGVGGGEDGNGDDNSQTATSSVMNANPNSTVANALSNSTNTTTNNTTTKTELTITHSFDFSKLPANMTTAQIESILTEWAKNPINANELVMAAAKINSGIINV